MHGKYGDRYVGARCFYMNFPLKQNNMFFWIHLDTSLAISINIFLIAIQEIIELALPEIEFFI